MKHKDAKKLIGNVVRCGLYANGVIEDKPDNIEATLADLVKANKIVERSNEKAREKQQREGGICSSQMTVADRGLAAMYTAASFIGGTPSEPNVVGYANGNYVLVISEASLKFEKTNHHE